MKKILLILLVMIIGVSSAYSSIIQIGPTATLDNVDIFKGKDAINLDTFDYKDVSNYQFGLETRLNFLFLSAHLNAFYQAPNADLGVVSTIDTSLFGILDFSFFNIIRFGVGPGFHYMLDFTNIPEDSDTVLENSTIDLKAHLTFNVGKVGVSAYYILPTAFKYNEIFNPLVKMFDPEKGTVGVSLLFGL